MKPWIPLLMACAGPLAAETQAPSAVSASANQDEQRLDVRVTAAVGDTLFLDAGSAAGVQVGDDVRIDLPGGGRVEAEVVAVTEDACRARLRDANVAVPVGAPGTVLIQEVEGLERGDLPWSSPESPFDSNTPLLAPVEAPAPEDREATWKARLYASGYGLRDRAFESQDSSRLRTGVAFDGTNLFGRGGQFELDVEYQARDYDAPGGSRDSQALRIERLAYGIGGDRQRPLRTTVGRFIPTEFPQLGLTDGLELNQRLPSGDHLGTTVGFLPEFGPDLKTGDDLAAAVWYRYVSDDKATLTAGVAAQKTWHEGESDRDLLILDGGWRPSPALWLSVDLFVDFYGSEDTLKDSGPELTQFSSSGTWRPRSDTSLRLSASRFRWPQLLRDELPLVEDATILDGEYDRVGLSWTEQLTDSVRLFASGDHYDDGSDSGLGGSLDLSLRDAFGSGTELFGGLYSLPGTFTEVQGLRLGVGSPLPKGYLRLQAELSQFTEVDAQPGSSERDVLALRGDLDLELGAKTFLSLYAETRSGDDEDAVQVGFLLTRRWRSETGR